MKLTLKMLAVAALATAASGCSSFIDINNNPNSFTTANAPTPDAILAQALTVTAANYNGNTPSFNSYASFAADYWGRSGVIVAYAEERTYNYTTAYMQLLFGNTYDNLNDYSVMQQGAASYPNHAAIARIMKAYNFLLLVDEYGDIPYTQALQGTANLTPVYDKAPDIYKDLLVQLQGAVTDINSAGTTARAVGPEDIVFAGNMTRWKQFANSLRLRILLRESQTNDAALNASIATQMTALQTATDGFITTDVLANPGYTTSSGQTNPFYNRYGATFTGGAQAERNYQVPTNYVIRQYTSNNDTRISVLYTAGKSPNGYTLPATGTVYFGTNAGEQSPPLIATTNPVYASRFLLGTATVTAGLLKGQNAPTALMLASEHFFNKAEAETRGLFTGGDVAAKADYERGILGSFMYFYRPATTAAVAVPTSASPTSTVPGVAQYSTFMTAAVTAKNTNVSYDDAASTGALGKQYVILYQKYLAMNSVGSTEAWCDYRRAAQPKIEASLEANTAGRLAKRLLYPLTEVNTNQANIPKIDQYTPIFWDVID